MCIYDKSFYLETPLYQYEYISIKEKCIPKHFMDLYNLHEIFKNGYVYLKIQRDVYGLLQSGILAKNQLKDRISQ